MLWVSSRKKTAPESVSTMLLSVSGDASASQSVCFAFDIRSWLSLSRDLIPAGEAFVLRIGLARGPSLMSASLALFGEEPYQKKTVVTHRFKLKGLAIFGVRSGELMVVPTLFQEMPSEWQR
jgi:hypothetical protein